MLRKIGAFLFLAFLLVACTDPKAEVKDERTFRFASFHPPKNLHPLSGFTGPPLQLLYRHLVWQLNPNSRKLDLLESYEVSKDGSECILHLRKNVRFHDGSLMTAEDVAYTYRRMKQSPEIKIFSISWTSDLHVDVIDQFTVRMRSKNIQDWGFILTFPILSAKYEKEWVKKDLSGYIPMGTGTYRFISYDREKQVIKL